MRRVLRWPVPVDDRPHRIGGGYVVLVQCTWGRDDLVQVWTEEMGESERLVQVFGTGHPLPYDLQHVGSAISGSGLVWHVYGDRG